MFFKIKNHVLRVYYESVMSVELKYHVAKKKKPTHPKGTKPHVCRLIKIFFCLKRREPS